MNTKDIILFVFDTKENFENSKRNLGTEGSAFKKIICVEDYTQFEREFSLLKDEEYTFMVVHAFYTEKIGGLKRFAASLISKKYPQLGFMYISEGDSKEINKQMVDAEIKNDHIYKYWQVQENLENNLFKVHRKQEIIQFASSSTTNATINPSQVIKTEYPQCDYAIITALEEDEMEKVLPIIERIDKIKNTKHLIEYGYLKSNPQKKIAYSSQLSTGMVDASILATEMLIRFNPKFLIMTGVLGGKPDKTNIGDVVVSTKVFTIDKGKISNEEFKREIEATSTDSSYITAFKRNKKNIIEYIKESDDTRKNHLDIHFEPMACVRHVIDKEGYFEENISSVDRKTIALEMESYGIARACELVNDGKTTPLIIKSVMDNTKDKTDGAKTYAAWTSSMFLKYILEKDLI